MTQISTVARLSYTGSGSGLTVGDIRAFCTMIDECDEIESLEVIGTACFAIEAVILLADREE